MLGHVKLINSYSSTENVSMMMHLFFVIIIS